MLVIGFPKSGNTWFCYLLAYCLNVPYDNLAEPGQHPRDTWQRKLVKGGLSHTSHAGSIKDVLSTHEVSALKDYAGEGATICLVRDGRDVMVSYYHYISNFLVEEQKRGGAGKTDTNEPPDFTSFIKERCGEWKEHVEACLAESPDAILRYEDLHGAPEQTLKNIFQKLGTPVEGSVIEAALDEFNFKKFSGRERGEADNTNFFRKGIVGDWKNTFEETDREMFKQIAGELLIKLGYETDSNWQ
ncbi:MAG: sulfotransferase domain-containing protein [Thermodesulfobacteriota bacterium]